MYTEIDHTNAHQRVQNRPSQLKITCVFICCFRSHIMSQFDEIWRFYLGSRTRDSANRRLALNHWATVACIRSDTRHRARVVKIQASVRGIPASIPEKKISRFHRNRDVLADNSTTSLVCILRHFSLCVPTSCLGHHGWASVIMVVRRLAVLAHRTASFSLGTGNAHQWWGNQAILLLLG